MELNRRFKVFVLTMFRLKLVDQKQARNMYWYDDTFVTVLKMRNANRDY